MQSIRWIGFTHSHLHSYQAFAERMYGRESYQTSEAYINWLYRENPHGPDLQKDFKVGVTDNERVVGCIHKMRLPWRVAGERVDVPAVHNLMVDPKYRKGLGFMLTMASFGSERHALIPAVDGPLADAYDKLGLQPIRVEWYRRVLKPLSGALQLTSRKLLGRGGGPRWFEADDTESRCSDGCSVRVAPPKELIEQVSALTHQTHRGQTSPEWSVELVSWRFFHPEGPRHLLVYLTEADELSDFLILSLGPRRGVNVGRIVAASVRGASQLETLLRAGIRTLKNHGCVVLLTYCADPGLNEMFTRLGWNGMARTPRSFFYHQTKSARFESYALMGAAGDFGFEAFCPQD
ncbi:MAG: GNAT family N-acetyltransferase [Candidatus Krumholzibacteria bacterium]|nr:GNAT family N-acetyltransferase [Candidatus Krumholzibacteria bacterium]